MENQNNLSGPAGKKYIEKERNGSFWEVCKIQASKLGFTTKILAAG